MFDVSSLSVRLACILRDAVRVLARLGPSGAASGPVLVAILGSVERRLRRFERLMARVAAGRPTSRRAAVRAKPVPEAEGSADKARGLGPEGRPMPQRRARLVPRGFGWAVAMAQGTAVFGCQLQAMLAEPAVIEVLERTPEARAILRPLCRMLAVPVPDMLRPPGWTARPKRVRKTRGCQYPGGENWPGFKANQAKWDRIFAAVYAGQPPWRPPRG